MISAFKHIRLSGYNLTPIQSAAWDNSSTLRLGFGNSGLAYYSELTGISGYLKDLINQANADVGSLNNLQGNLYITGGDGIRIDVDSLLGEIKVVGNSGYFQALSNQVSSNLAATGSNLYDLFTRFTNSSTTDISAISGQIAQTGSILDNKVNSLSGYANATFVAKTSQQVFTKTLVAGLDAYQIDFPVSFGGAIPKVLATLEVPGDVMYNLSTKRIGTAGYTGLLSDNILEDGAVIHTFASTQN